MPLTIPALSANRLRAAGAVLAAIYFFGLIVQNGMLHASRYSSEELYELAADDEKVFFLLGVSSVCYLIGVIAIPIFSFLLVQGILHTASIRKYVLIMLICAAAAEVPYDLAVSGKAFNMSDQNVLWTALIAIVMLWLLKIFQGRGLVPFLINLLIVLGGCFWAVFLNCKFGGGFVLLTAILFLLREKRGLSIALGAALCLIYATAPLGFIPVALYSGERGKGGD